MALQVHEADALGQFDAALELSEVSKHDMPQSSDMDSDSIFFISDLGLVCDGSQELDFTFVNELPWGETKEEKANAESK